MHKPAMYGPATTLADGRHKPAKPSCDRLLSRMRFGCCGKVPVIGFLSLVGCHVHRQRSRMLRSGPYECASNDSSKVKCNRDAARAFDGGRIRMLACKSDEHGCCKSLRGRSNAQLATNARMVETHCKPTNGQPLNIRKQTRTHTNLSLIHI